MLTEENVNIAEYIAEDQNNIVLKYGNEKYFFTKCSTIKRMFEDTSSTFYGCYYSHTVLTPRDRNASQKIKYLSLKSIGLIRPNNYYIMEMLTENFAHQLFYVYDLDYTFELFTSEAVLNGGTVVSALHS